MNDEWATLTIMSFCILTLSHAHCRRVEILLKGMVVINLECTLKYSGGRGGKGFKNLCLEYKQYQTIRILGDYINKTHRCFIKQFFSGDANGQAKLETLPQ